MSLPLEPAPPAPQPSSFLDFSPGGPDPALGQIPLPEPLDALAARSWDVVIVGAGHNGLTCAAYLARAGRRVLVLESRDRLGGACSFERSPAGVLRSPCAYLCGLLHPRVIRDLDLVRRGLRWMLAEAGMFVPLPDGDAVHFHGDPERCRAEIRRFRPGDVRGWEAWQELFAFCRDRLRPDSDADLWLGDAPDRATIAARLDHRSDALDLLFHWSMADLLDHFLEDERLRLALLGQGVIGTYASPFDAGTAAVHFHHSSGRMFGRAGAWGYIEGGMGRVSLLLADAAREAGAALATGVTVSRIQAGSHVEDVEGRRFRAPVLVSNATPAATLALLGHGADPAWAGRVQALPVRGCTLKVNATLSALPDFRCRPGAPAEHHRGQVNTPLTPEEWRAGFAACQAGLLPDRLWTELYFHTAFDPTVAPPGLHSMSMFCQYVPQQPAGGLAWDDLRDRAGLLALDALARYASNIPAAVVELEALGPPDLEARLGLTGGHIFHGEILPDYLWDRRLSARTPMPGFYLCGAGTHPGGSVIAGNGRNAASAILRDTA